MEKIEFDDIDALRAKIGEEFGAFGEQVEVEQQMIDRFAELTGDHQWIHVDVERCRKESPFGGPIAHGFLTLSLLPRLRQNLGLIPDGVAHALNYGLDRVRFLAPVRTGSRIRVRVQLLSVADRGTGRTLVKTENTVEIAGEAKPALVAETLVLLISTPSP